MWPPELFKAYEEGKSRRYQLLFAVNGGAFALAKLLSVPQEQPDKVSVLGGLSLLHLSVGMVVFTALMIGDIFLFGQKMRARVPGLFGWLGKTVVTGIGLLIAAGWMVVAFAPPWAAWLAIGSIVVLAVVFYFAEGNVMQEDINELIRVNEEINTHEISGNAESVKKLAELTASELAFRRRGGAIVDKEGFLGSPSPGGRTIQIESVQVYGKRAVVTCRVNRPGEITHNIRLFVKGDKGWQVLGWANEPA